MRHYGIRSLAVSLELLIKHFVWVDCQKFIFQLFDILLKPLRDIRHPCPPQILEILIREPGHCRLKVQKLVLALPPLPQILRIDQNLLLTSIQASELSLKHNFGTFTTAVHIPPIESYEQLIKVFVNTAAPIFFHAP